MSIIDEGLVIAAENNVLRSQNADLASKARELEYQLSQRDMEIHNMRMRFAQLE